MGMYDSVICEKPLPGWPEGVEPNLQTKSLDCNLDTYTITAEGKLLQKTCDYEQVPEEERPYYGKPEWDSPLGKFMGSIRPVNERTIEVPFHGDITFYDYLEGQPVPWYEYRARFTNGTLESIEQTSPL